MKKTVPIIGMACSACSANVQRKLDELEGINQANVNLVGRSAFIDFDETSITLEEIKRELPARFPELSDGREMKIQEVNKVNESYMGLVLSGAENEAIPALNLNMLYEDYYVHDQDMDAILGLSKEILSMKVPEHIARITADMKDYEKMRPNLIARVCSADRNSEILKEMPHMIMEDLVMAYNSKFKVTSARFANVAFSNGSLPDGWLHRLQKKQPLAAPSDVKRYFVSPEESGQICMLACILGEGGEIFFPKLSEDQMLSFSTICDAFVSEEGFRKKECADDAEARKFAASMDFDSDSYPVVYFESDTTGEKPYEEFYTPGEPLDMDRFSSLGVIKASGRRPLDEIDSFFGSLEALFARPDFTKAEVVEAIKGFIPNFEHEEKGKNLDQRM